jgi:hypothetical protein
MGKKMEVECVWLIHSGIQLKEVPMVKRPTLEHGEVKRCHLVTSRHYGRKLEGGPLEVYLHWMSEEGAGNIRK